MQYLKIVLLFIFKMQDFDTLQDKLKELGASESTLAMTTRRKDGSESAGMTVQESAQEIQEVLNTMKMIINTISSEE